MCANKNYAPVKARPFQSCTCIVIPEGGIQAKGHLSTTELSEREDRISRFVIADPTHGVGAGIPRIPGVGGGDPHPQGQWRGGGRPDPPPALSILLLGSSRSCVVGCRPPRGVCPSGRAAGGISGPCGICHQGSPLLPQGTDRSRFFGCGGSACLEQSMAFILMVCCGDRWCGRSTSPHHAFA